MIKAGEQYLTDICTMKGCTVKIVIFYFFSRHDLTAPHTKFHVSQTPPSCFLLIYDPFLTNIWRKYFSCNHFTVLHQLKLKWSNLDQNWAKSQPLLFKIPYCSLWLHSALMILSTCCQQGCMLTKMVRERCTNICLKLKSFTFDKLMSY